MSGIAPKAIQRIYRDVLIEALASARVSAKVPVDTDDEAAIRQWFLAIIPTAVPERFAGQIESPTLRATLRSEAATKLLQICQRMPLPRGPFVAAVAEAALSKI